MKKLLEKLENIFASIAFAEAGEHGKAREILRESSGQEANKLEESSALYSQIPLVPEPEDE